VVGYVDASWTLGADATAQLICRLLKQMEKEGAGAAIPRLEKGEEGKMKKVPMLRLQSTYMKRAKGALPKAGEGLSGGRGVPISGICERRSLGI
jgi:hypothetical protein